MIGEFRNGKPWNINEYDKNGNFIATYMEGKYESEPEPEPEPIPLVVLFWNHVNGELGWHKFGNQKKEGKYLGEVGNGKPNGQGTYTDPDGGKFVGEWKDGHKNGIGTLTFPSGNKLIGEFRNDKPWNITNYDSFGHVTGNWVEGEKQ